MRALSRVAIRLVAVLYLAGLFFEGVGFDPPLRGLPAPLHYALEVAALFPDAAKSISEYRAEAWVCGTNEWRELDTRKYFPLHPDDKENRFQRSLHFYNDESVVKRALTAYLAESHDSPETNDPNDGIAPRAHEIERVGGVRLLVVNRPVPSPGDRLTAYSIVPLKDLPPDTTKTVFFEPTKADLAARCEAKARSDEGQEGQAGP